MVGRDQFDPGRAPEDTPEGKVMMTLGKQGMAIAYAALGKVMQDHPQDPPQGTAVLAVAVGIMLSCLDRAGMEGMDKLVEASRKAHTDHIKHRKKEDF